MSGVFQNNDPFPPPTARRVCPPPAFGGEGGGWVKSSEDARHSSVLYICKYFVAFANPKDPPPGLVS